MPQYGYKALYVLALLIVVPHYISAQKVKVEYNPKDSFKRFRTYSWALQESYQRPLLAMHVVGAIDEQLQAKGLTRIDTGGDLIVTAYAALDSDLNVAYRPEIYAMPGLTGPAWWTQGVWVPGNSTAVYIKKGTLVVDIAEPQTKQLKWRGIGKSTLDSTNHKRSMDKINKSIEKMFRDFPAHK